MFIYCSRYRVDFSLKPTRNAAYRYFTQWRDSQQHEYQKNECGYQGEQHIAFGSQVEMGKCQNRKRVNQPVQPTPPGSQAGLQFPQRSDGQGKHEQQGDQSKAEEDFLRELSHDPERIEFKIQSGEDQKVKHSVEESSQPQHFSHRHQ
jgi:hypothetical protein